jgi:hypothetical protein|tara:strand:+ start:14061 stop:14255 length:195 start_codon:yes stop_codon:yes gene_type:complete
MEILKDYKDKPNKHLLTEMDKLKTEFDKTKDLIIKLTLHLDSVEGNYNLLNDEMKKRYKDGGRK